MEVIRRNTDYGLRMMVTLAKHSGNGELMSASQLVRKGNISYEVGRKQLQKLRDAKLVKSVMGSKGGFKLNRKSSEIMISDILDLFNDSIKDEQCVLGIGFCNGMCKCALHDQWMEPKLLLQKMFRESSLKDIAGRGCKI